ncbi:ethanolamine ammonia-lyase subunit EutC [Deinococcus humi]|uniref:Ethanolamine ammonia-lyase small subunit n=1 Tax=Deinococcus humi TaxID=662880 RepID=A0A7W8JU11_9DEIO|nr:ethanolamine ammonia-lyase subunit EutC [Deinococcus humi]MBB5363200.1 ethanolamine ammonia-lyase small subunit [Deinococcus humi]GGO27708.1 ethanolamine ammonia-lyase light chain [Deinococcus humi]
MTDGLNPDDLTPWSSLRHFTDARIALGRAGTSLPTRELLRFNAAHAAARDAVHAPADFETLAAVLSARGEVVLNVHSRAADRAEYLRRPDLGRTLAPESLAALEGQVASDVVVVVADGLSAGALAHVPPLLALLLPELRSAGLSVGPVVLARQARVALGDPVALALGARLVLVLIGERPGLSSPDSLGAYLTFAPQLLTRDSARNCVSNIRPAGLSVRVAAWRLAHLIRQALRRELSGVTLKDEGGEPPPDFAPLPRA